ncbi:MAG: hypothetical protein ABI775_14800 [Pseudonocardiales bacterium]
MSVGSSLGVLLNGPSPGIVAAILLLAIAAAAAVFWTLLRLIVDPRRSLSEDPDQPDRLGWDEPGDSGYDDGYALRRGDGTG